jgi:hypothetical protein
MPFTIIVTILEASIPVNDTVDAVQKVKRIRNKFKKSMIRNHGVEYTAQSSKLMRKMQRTTVRNYGVTCPFSSKEVREKSKETMLERYGVEYNMQDREIFERQQKEYDQYLLTSNRVHGDWDWEKLAENFDIELLKVSGFDDTDMSHIFDTLEVENDEFDEDKELARIKTPKTKVGEMYQIGRHRVICGDSTEQSVVQRLVGKERVSLIYSDPPYNISYDYDRGLGGRGNYGGHVDDSKSEADYESFLKKTIENALVVSKKDIHCFYWADQCGSWKCSTVP